MVDDTQSANTVVSPSFAYQESFPKWGMPALYKWHRHTLTCMNGRNSSEAEFTQGWAAMAAQPGFRSWGVYMDGDLVGVMYFCPIWQGGQLVDGTIHATLARKAWGYKAATRGFREIILPTLFQGSQLLRVSSQVPDGNNLALTGLSELGFHGDGTKQDAILIDSTPRDLVLMGLTRREYEQSVRRSNDYKHVQ